MITLQFSTEKSFLSSIIRWASWSDWSHVDIVMPDGSLIGARFDGGVQKRVKEYAPFTKIEQVSFEADVNQELMFYVFLHKQMNKPYDWKAIVGFGIEWDTEREGGINTSKWFCSELVYAAALYAGVHLLREDFVDRVTPGLLACSPLLHKVSDGQVQESNG